MPARTYALFAAAIDLVHALTMLAWVVGLPLLFVRRWPSLSRAYAIYAVSFILLYQGSRLVLGTCFLTTFAGALWDRAGWPIDAQEWFTVRAARFVFGFAPSRHWISIATQLLTLVTAIGLLAGVKRRKIPVDSGAATAIHR